MKAIEWRMSKFKLEYTHCSECGTPFVNLSWPRECGACGKLKWNNPMPVAIVLQPVEHEGRRGLAVGRRAIEPAVGKWSLIGGFMEATDQSAEDGARREFREETSLGIAHHPRLVYSTMTQSGQLLCVCVIDKALTLEEYNKGICCPENSELDVLWDPDQKDIAFPLHREAISRWFNKEFE